MEHGGLTGGGGWPAFPRIAGSHRSLPAASWRQVTVTNMVAWQERGRHRNEMERLRAVAERHPGMVTPLPV